MKHLQRLLAAATRGAVFLVLWFILLRISSFSVAAASPTPTTAAVPAVACCPDHYHYLNGYCQLSSCEIAGRLMCTGAAFGVTSITPVGPIGGFAAGRYEFTRGSFCDPILSGSCHITTGIDTDTNILRNPDKSCALLVGAAMENNPINRELQEAAPDQYAAFLAATVDNCKQAAKIYGSFYTTDSACTSAQTCDAEKNTCVADVNKFKYLLCDQTGADNSDAKTKCMNCLNTKGIWTAVGCVETSAQGIVTKIMAIGLGVAGGLGLLMILVAAFMLSTSQGEPKRTSEAKEILQAAVIGLLFIIFSVTILQFIGVTILHVPGFGT